MKVKLLSRVQLCDPVDCSPPGSSVHGISQARILEWVTISLSQGSSRPRDRTQVSRIAGRQRQMPADSLTSEPPGKPRLILEIMPNKFLCGCKYLAFEQECMIIYTTLNISCYLSRFVNLVGA